jgi:pimeloyl-ACP methyl ester carboxylesterase
LSKLVLADTLYSAEMWQKGNNETTTVEVENQLPELWTEIQQLRAKGLNNDVYCQIAGRDADFTLGGDMASIDFRSKLRDIRAPTLVLAGRFDRVAIPRYAVQFKTLMPRAEFVMFEQSGHMPFAEEPATPLRGSGAR